MAVASAASLVKVGHVIATGERSIGKFFLEELAQGAPAVVDIVFQETIRGNQAADQLHMFIVDLLALAGEVSAEEGLEEGVEHGVVHASRPAEVGNQLVLGVAHSPVNGLHDGSVPGIHVAGGQDDLGVRVGFDKLFGKGASGPVADGLTVTQELIPFLAAKLANALVFSIEGVVPHQTVGWILDTGAHHVVALDVS